MNSKLKLGIIGAGQIASTHASILSRNDDIILSHVFDIDTNRSNNFAKKFNMITCANQKELIDNCDAVYITLPNYLHSQAVIQALKENKSVFCEKPMAVNLDEAQTIANLVEQKNLIYQLGFSRRFSPAYTKMKELITTNQLTVSSFNIKMNRGELQNPPWTSNIEITGGFLYESTLHLFDMLNFLLGPIKNIQAIGSKNHYPCVDNFSLLFEMENSSHGVFSSCAHTSWIFPFERVELYGVHGSCFNDEMEKVHYCTSLEQEVITKNFGLMPWEKRWGYIQENDYFIEQIIGRPISDEMRSIIPDHKDGLANVQLIEKIYAQINKGK